MSSINLTNHFLIAMPSLTDGYFAQALVYIAEHSEQGALGLIVNRPIEQTLSVLLHKIDLPHHSPSLAQHPVFLGGPLHPERGFVLHRPIGEWQSTLNITPNLGLTSSRDVLQSLTQISEPQEMLVAVGYSGWGEGQLESELAQNSWLTVSADPHILFDLPYAARWPAALKNLGVDAANLASFAGHA